MGRYEESIKEYEKSAVLSGSSPEAAAAARDFWMFYNRTREAKKTEFLKMKKKKF